MYKTLELLYQVKRILHDLERRSNIEDLFPTGGHISQAPGMVIYLLFDRGTAAVGLRIQPAGYL